MSANPIRICHPDRPIGVFDSGVGGLSVLRHIRRRLPGESLLYVADTAFAPYGDRANGEILERVALVSEWLVAQQAKMLVLACNTATAVAIRWVRERYPGLQVVGMEPGLKPAVAGGRGRTVGIIATSGTLRSDKFRLLLERYGGSAEVVVQACPGLVEQVERGRLEHAETEALLRRYLEPLMHTPVDALVLGCTHYPYLLPLIRQIVGEGLQVVDTGAAVARQVESQLDLHRLRSQPGCCGTARFVTTGGAASQHPLFRRLWGSDLELEQADIAVEGRGGHPVSAYPTG